MTASDWSTIVLAAGRGTRMKGVTPKPLITLGGQALIEPILELTAVLTPGRTVVVISEVTKQVGRLYADTRREFLEVEPRGTADSVSKALVSCETPYVLIAQADDSYFLRLETVQQMLSQHEEHGADFTVGAARVTTPTNYAHIERTPDRKLLAVRKQPSDLLAPPPKEIVAGLYAARVDWLRAMLPQVTPAASGEYGLPSVIDLGIAAGDRIDAFVIPEGQWQGINTPEEYALAEQKLTRQS